MIARLQLELEQIDHAIRSMEPLAGSGREWVAPQWTAERQANQGPTAEGAAHQSDGGRCF